MKVSSFFKKYGHRWCLRGRKLRWNHKNTKLPRKLMMILYCRIGCFVQVCIAVSAKRWHRQALATPMTVVQNDSEKEVDTKKSKAVWVWRSSWDSLVAAKIIARTESIKKVSHLLFSIMLAQKYLGEECGSEYGCDSGRCIRSVVIKRKGHNPNPWK